MHLKTRIDAYLVVTRSKNPSNKSAVIASIEAALCDLGLDVKDFATKSTNYGNIMFPFNIQNITLIPNTNNQQPLQYYSIQVDIDFDVFWHSLLHRNCVYFAYSDTSMGSPYLPK